MREQRGIGRCAGLFKRGDHFPQLRGVPVDDDGGEQVQPGQTVMLAFGRAVANFAASTERDRAFEGVMRFAFVQARLGAAAQIEIGYSG